MRNTYLFLISAVSFCFSCSDNKIDQNENLTEKKEESDAVGYSPSSNSQFSESKASNSETNDLSPNSASDVQTSIIKERKIIKEGTISIETNNLNTGKIGVDKIIKHWKCYYEKEEYGEVDNQIYFDLTLRIPSENFDNVIHDLENGGNKITEKSIRANDVSAEYVDVETRLASKKEYLKRYYALLSKANTVAEIIAIEEIIRGIEEEIESKIARLNFLSDQVGYGTLKIKLFQQNGKIVIDDEPGFSSKLWTSIQNGWNIILMVILAVFKILPLLILGLIVFYIIRKYRKR